MSHPLLKYHHQPVMLDTLLQEVLPLGAKYALDATLGEGGHSEALLRRGVCVMAIERDDIIAKSAQLRLKNYLKNKQLTIVSGNYGNAQLSAFSAANERFDFALFDLGISKFHYFASGKGFSFANAEPLDMRLDDTAKKTAAEVVNFYSESALADVLYNYGEMTNARVMARHICKQRKNSPINTALQLAEIIKAGPHYSFGRLHPATQAFQALRVYVNNELLHIEDGIKNAVLRMNVGGRLAVISYHSLEDRIVKKTFHKMLIKRENRNKYAHLKNSAQQNSIKDVNLSLQRENTAPNNHVLKMPRCQLLYKKAFVASRSEVQQNRAARSAKLRVLEVQ